MHGPTVRKIIKKFRETGRVCSYSSFKSKKKLAPFREFLLERKEEIKKLFENNKNLNLCSIRKQFEFIKTKLSDFADMKVNVFRKFIKTTLGRKYKKLKYISKNVES